MKLAHRREDALSPTDLVIVIPTLNASRYLDTLLPALIAQNLARSSYLFMDSSSTDDTVARCRAFGAEVVIVDRSTFSHGGTRQQAVDLRPDAKFIVMLTQDAIPADPDSLVTLLSAFQDATVGMAYGRQLARPEAKAIERHARIVNYPPEGETRSFADRLQKGIKTTFCSDAFAAYRRSALEDVGGFPLDAFFAEDQIVAGKMLKKGWNMAYVGDARVTHSHGYSVTEEFKRYFDVGVFHARNAWLLSDFGKAEGEGLRFIKSELSYLVREERSSIPSSILRTLSKYLGYKLGCAEGKLSARLKSQLSMQGFYWKRSIRS